MIEETWKDVIYGPVKKGMYEASNKGRIRNKLTGHIGSNNGMAVIDEKIAEIACEALRFYCGNIQMTMIALRKHGIKIDNSKLYDIKRKRTWVEISDKYFTRTWILGIKFLKEETVEEICREIKKADGDLNKSYEEIKLWGEPTIPKEYIIAIANKAYWVGVSNKFFKDEYKLEFYSEKFNDYRN